MGQSLTTALPISMQPSIAAVALLAASAFAAPQFQGDSSLARILQEQRFNMGDGKFGSAFAQEDGTISKEESTGNNERIGQYSYIDDTGKTITVKYSAGVNGFRILEGDHIPSGGQKSAQNLNTVEGAEPKEYEYEYYDDTVPESPFVNPFDTSHQQQQFLMAGDLAGHLAQRVSPPSSPPLRVHQPPSPPRGSSPLARSSWTGSPRASTSSSSLRSRET